MSTIREAILEALHQRVAAVAGYSVGRNTPLGELEGTYVSLNDGGMELGEEFINGPQGSIYEFTATPALTIIVQHADAAPREALLDAAIEAFAEAIEDEEAAPLHAQATDVRVLPADFGVKEIWGGTDMKGAELPIEIDFWSNRRSG